MTSNAPTAWDLREERQSLTAEERRWLADLARESIRWGARRPAPVAVRTLLLAGLAFRSAVGISITARGEEVLALVG